MEYNYILYFIIFVLSIILITIYKFNSKSNIESSHIDKLINKIEKNDNKIEKLLSHTIKYLNKDKRLNFPKVDTINKRSLFNKDYIKKNILIDTNSIVKNKNFNYGNYTYDFLNNDTLQPGMSGFGEIRNIIGFKLIKAIIPQKQYTITKGINDKFIYKSRYNSNIYTIIITLIEGTYNINNINESFPTNTDSENYHKEIIHSEDELVFEQNAVTQEPINYSDQEAIVELNQNYETSPVSLNIGKLNENDDEDDCGCYVYSPVKNDIKIYESDGESYNNLNPEDVDIDILENFDNNINVLENSVNIIENELTIDNILKLEDKIQELENRVIDYIKNNENNIINEINTRLQSLRQTFTSKTSNVLLENEETILKNIIYITKNNVIFDEENNKYKIKFTCDEKSEISFYNNILNSNYSMRKSKILINTYKTFGIIDDENIFNKEIETNHIPYLLSNHIDLAIDEIPNIVCKYNSFNRKIIDRIPLQSNGTNMIYIPELQNSDNFFTPITLDKLSIKLWDSSGFNYYNPENADHFLEFEVTQLIDDKNVGLIGPN